MKMKIKKLSTLILVLSTIILSTSLTLSPLFAGESTEDIVKHHKNSVLQIRILDIGSNAKAGIGSGFAVSSDGYIISNYHVIAELVVNAGQYRAEYLSEDGKKGDLQLVDIDVVHDLALLKATGLGGEFLQLEKKNPAKGETLFSMGNPFDLGLTIVEGIFNGFLEKSLYKKIHFTGSINPGMSGGPTLNKSGSVVGINVATAGNQVSFLVPVRYAITLLKRGSQTKKPITDFSKIVSSQLLENQESYMDSLLDKEFASVTMGRYKIPGELSPFIKCWGDTRKGDDLLYDQVYQTCATDDDIFISAILKSGSIRFTHELFQTQQLSATRFYNFLESHFQQPHSYLSGDEESLGNFECKTDFVKHNNLESKVVFCIRGYKDLKEVYDSYITATTFSSTDEALHTTLVLSGVSYENALLFSKTYMESISWTR